MKIRTIDQLDLSGKRTLIRVDFNVPMDKAGNVTDDTRLQAVLPTIRLAIERGAKTILLSHLGRPKGKRLPEMSLAPVAPCLSRLLGRPVAFAQDCVGEPAEVAVAAMNPGDVLLLENVRYEAGEEKNDEGLGRRLAALCDVYVNDAFEEAGREPVLPVALLFAVGHFVIAPSPFRLLTFFPGLLLGWGRKGSGNVYVPTAVHFLYNLFPSLIGGSP